MSPAEATAMQAKAGLPTDAAQADRRRLVGMATAAPADFSSAGNAAGEQGQMALAGTLQSQAAGGGTSAADIQQQQGIQQSILAQQAGAAMSGNSGNPFLMQRQLAMQAAQTQAQGAGQAALLRANETQQAQQALGATLGQLRGQSLTQSAGEGQLTSTNRLGAASLIDNADNRDASSALTAAGQQTARDIASANNDAAMARQKQGEEITGKDILGAASSAIGAGAGIIATKSDEREKTNIDRSKTDRQLDEFMARLDRASFDYKHPDAYGNGHNFGIMAQSAERSDAGRTMVTTLPDGETKGLDMRKAMGLALASLSRLNERQDQTESLLDKAVARARG